MTIVLQALREARNALTAELGSLDDLSPAARNTLANIYYRFHLVSVSAKRGDLRGRITPQGRRYGIRL